MKNRNVPIKKTQLFYQHNVEKFVVFLYMHNLATSAGHIGIKFDPPTQFDYNYMKLPKF